jgi:prepilin-type processing-associated H-X9-DG protein
MQPVRTSRRRSSPWRSLLWPARRGESSNTTVIIIVVCVVAGLCLLACIPCMIALLLPAVQQAREAARRTQSMNNLKQMGLGMHNFHDLQSHWPGGTVSPDGTPLHSWQTELLPFVDQQPVYQIIDQNVPWNDPANTGAFMTEVPTYLHPNQSQRRTADGYAASHYAGNQFVIVPGQTLSLREVTDGTANTIAAGEVGSGFRPWGDPGNVRDPSLGINANPDGFGSASPGGANMLLMDGSVRFVSENIDSGVLKALATPAGGEQVGSF